MTAYEPENLFARILRGEIPSVKVYEDETALVMMDIFPQSRGHTLILPKAPSRNLLDAAPETLAQVMPLVQKIARAVQKATDADGIRIAQFNEEPAGQTVFHLHFHVIPVYEGTPIGRHASGGQADTTELQALARNIAANLA